jgi:flagellar biosynthesis/type III secretory pathway protein FliH
MLRETVAEWTRQWLEEGRQEGRQQGEARLLLRQLERKFGTLSEAHRTRVQGADAEELLSWAERLLTARSLSEVFGDGE